MLVYELGNTNKRTACTSRTSTRCNHRIAGSRGRSAVATRTGGEHGGQCSKSMRLMPGLSRSMA